MLSNPKDVHGKLCYVNDSLPRLAYFTTAPLVGPDCQWGDDWNDAPYEHNAGEPYVKEGHDLHCVMFEAGELGTPCTYFNNSRFSVESINHLDFPWLMGNGVAIFAGITFSEFVRLLRQGGGNILVPWEGSIDG